MVNYDECHKECACYCNDKNKKECLHKSLCKALELPIETEESMKKVLGGY